MIQGSDDIASRAIDLLKEIYTNLGPKLQANQVIVLMEMHITWCNKCCVSLELVFKMCHMTVRR